MQQELTSERAYWLAWTQVHGVGPILLKRLQEHFGSLGKAWLAPSQDLLAVNGFGTKILAQVDKTRSHLEPARYLQQQLDKNPHFWTPADPEYPRLLLEIPTSPPILYHRGQMQIQENQGLVPMVGIVGTRHPTEYGRRWTNKISAALARHGFTIVSGLAAGIDAEAHRGCLAAGGRTVAVLGTGVDVAYPRSNLKLYREIEEKGLILSEYPLGTKADRKNFPPRNRIIAGLCRAVLVMEAAQKSGALITAKYANEFCRDVYALPGSLDNPQSMGCLGLLSKGAHLIWSVGHLLEMLGAIPQLDPTPQAEEKKPPLPDLKPELAKILQVISSEGISVDGIGSKTGLDANSIFSGLVELELLGLVTQLPGMRYKLGS